MKKIKIYLQYPWKFPDSPYYNYLLKEPPKNVEYINLEAREGLIISKKKFFFSNKSKELIRKVFGALNIPLPNAHLTKTKGNYDLIHCAHCLSKNNSPWVADFESYWQFLISAKRNKTGERMALNLMLSPNCKKIMPWTNYTRDEILKLFPEIKDKIEVVYPAIPVYKFKRQKHKRINILYIARYFWIKGGLIALESLSRLSEKYDIAVTFISDAPENIKKKYPEIDFLNLMPQKELFKYYEKADIFFYPSLVDTFGFAILEAMSFGLPIISVDTENTKTRKELIINGKNGFLIDAPKKLDYYTLGKDETALVNLLIKKTEKLIKNRGLRLKIAKNNLNEIKKGKFSVKERNKKLERIYREAIK